jgi:arylsulfatase
MAAFAGMVDCLDQNIGRLVAHLKAINRFDNTLFIFLSDNGACPFQRTKKETREQWLTPYDPESYWTYDEGWAHVGNTPFRLFKQNQHEGGISSPLIMHWPEVLTEKGALRTQPGHIIDVAATIFDAAGAQYPEEWEGSKISPIRGISLLPAATGKPGKSHDSIWQFFRNNRALRKGDWKIVMERTAKEWELYNMAEDRTEMHRLEDSRPELFSEMVEIYQRIDKEIQGHAPSEKAIDGQP